MVKQTALFFALLSACFLHAAPVGNTFAPDLLHVGFFIPCDSWIDLRMGYEGDFVTDGRMEQYQYGHGRVDNYQQTTNSGTVTLNFVNRMDVFGLFGASTVNTDWRFNEAGIIHIAKLDASSSFIWGAGTRIILYEWCNTSLGVGGRYSFCDYHSSSLSVDGISSSIANSTFKWREYQFNLDLAYKITYFTPYVGTKYSTAKTRLVHFSVPISSSRTGNNSFKNRDSFGFYVGCSLSNGNYFMLNIEGRLIDEEAVSVSADFRF